MVHLLGKVWHITYLYAVRTALSQGETCFQITLDDTPMYKKGVVGAGMRTPTNTVGSPRPITY